MSTRTVSVKLMADVANFTRNIGGSAVGATKSLTGELDKAAKAGKLDRVADQATRFGLAGVAAFGLVVKAAADFDKQMSAVSAATHASASDMDSLRKAALQAGKDTMFSATQAAEGETELAKAGVSTANILGGGLKGALDLAAAGQLSVGEAAETAATAMSQFKLKGDQVTHVADLLAAGAGKAQGSVHDMGYAFSQGGLVASQFGLSIEDTTGAFAEFANAGLIGSDAGTSFKQMLLSIANPSKVTALQMQALNIDFYDAQGNFIGLAGVAQVLQDRLKHLTEQQREQALGQIFGSDAVRAASVLYADGAKGVYDWSNKVNDAGYAAETAARQTDNLAGDLERLKGSFETLAIESGSGANGGLRVLTEGLNGIVNQALSLPPALGSAITVLLGVGGALGLALAGFIKLRSGLAKATEELTSMGPAGEKAASGLGKAAGAAGKAAAAFAIWQTAMAAATAIEGDTATNADALALGLQRFGQGADLSGESARVLGDNLGNLKTGFKFLADTSNDRRQTVKSLQESLEAVVPGLAGYSNSLSNTQAQIDAVDQQLAAMVSAGNAQDAADAFRRLSSELAVGGVSLDEFKAKFPSYQAALEVADSKTKKLSDSLFYVGTPTQEVKDKLDALGKTATDASGGISAVGAAADNAADEMNTMEKAVESLIGGQLSLDRADIAARDGMVGLKKELKDGSKSLSLNTVEGRKNRSAVLDQIAALDELRQSRIKHGMSLTDADKKYETDIAKMRDSLVQTTHNKKGVDELVGAYRKIPGDVSTDVKLTGAGAVATKLEGLSKIQQALASGTKIPINPATFFHGLSGGGWTGPGSKYEPAGVVHADEFVLQKDARGPLEAAKPGALDYMNKTGQWPGYSGGGTVHDPERVTVKNTKIPTAAQVMAAYGAFSGPAPHGALAGWIRSAESLTGTPSSWSGPLNVLIQRESGGNPRAINLSDSNAKAGDPSRGLMQTIGSTFEHYRLHSLPDDIYNPVANIVAGIRYIKSRYGSIFNVQQANPNKPPKGYWGGGHVAMAVGGVINEPVFGYGASGRSYSFGEGGRPETVIPGVLPRSSGRGGAQQVHVHAPISINGSNQSPEQIATAVSRNLGRQIDLAMRSS